MRLLLSKQGATVRFLIFEEQVELNQENFEADARTSMNSFHIMLKSFSSVLPAGFKKKTELKGTMKENWGENLRLGTSITRRGTIGQ